MNQNTSIETRMSALERTLQELRAADMRIERELILLRADFERLRVETQQAVGARLP